MMRDERPLLPQRRRSIEEDDLNDIIECVLDDEIDPDDAEETSPSPPPPPAPRQRRRHSMSSSPLVQSGRKQLTSTTPRRHSTGSGSSSNVNNDGGGVKAVGDRLNNKKMARRYSRGSVGSSSKSLCTLPTIDEDSNHEPCSSRFFLPTVTSDSDFVSQRRKASRKKGKNLNSTRRRRCSSTGSLSSSSSSCSTTIPLSSSSLSSHNESFTCDKNNDRATSTTSPRSRLAPSTTAIQNALMMMSGVDVEPLKKPTRTSDCDYESSGFTVAESSSSSSSSSSSTSTSVGEKEEDSTPSVDWMDETNGDCSRQTAERTYDIPLSHLLMKIRNVRGGDENGCIITASSPSPPSTSDALAAARHTQPLMIPSGGGGGGVPIFLSPSRKSRSLLNAPPSAA